MDIYRKNCKKHTGCTHPKLVVLISNRNAEVKENVQNAQLTERFSTNQLQNHWLIIFSKRFLVSEFRQPTQ